MKYSIYEFYALIIFLMSGPAKNLPDIMALINNYVIIDSQNILMDRRRT